MRKLIVLEWLKIRRYRAFWVLMGLYVIALIGINGIVSNVQGTISTRTEGNISLQLFEAPYLWNTTGWLAGFTLLLPGFLIIMLLSNEFSYKTFRQEIINGLSREQAILSKWLLLLGIAIGCWVIYFVVTAAIGNSGNANSGLFSGFQFAGFFFLKILLALSVAFILTIWIRRSGLTIGLFLVYYFMIEGIVGHYLNKVVHSLGDFLPLASGSMLMPNPFEKYLITQPVNQPADFWYVLAACGWILLLILLSVHTVRRADL